MSSTSSTSSSTSDDLVHSKNNDVQLAPCLVKKFDILFSNTTRYLVMDFNGEGGFGKVAKCVNLMTAETVAIKIHKKSKEHIIQREVKMLEMISALDPDKNNIVRFMDNFKFHNLSCLAFEMLDKSLWDLMKERKWMPLSIKEIRSVFCQLLVAFDALKGIGILHTDLKPDNIMLVSHKEQPFKVKLIDFGLALPINKVKLGMKMQVPAYRAPEVTLGLPLSEAVDMWGLGCVMGFLHFGINLFPRHCAYQWMKTMVQLLGQPEDPVLSAGTETYKYFSKEEGSSSSGWRLKSPEEYKEATGHNPQVRWRILDRAKNLEDAVQRRALKKNAVEYEEIMSFLSLLKMCLHPDGGKRVTPRQALKHTFITMVQLTDEKNSSTCVDDSKDENTTASNLDHSHKTNNFLTNHKTSTEVKGDKASESSNGVSSTDSSSEESDPTALKSILKREPSAANVSKKDSLTQSANGEDADIEYAHDVDSDTERSTGNKADIKTASSDNNIEPATKESYSGNPVETDRSSSDEDTIVQSEACAYFDDFSAPNYLERRSTPSICTHGSLSESSRVLLRDGLLKGEIFSLKIATGSSAAADFHGGVKDNTAHAKDEYAAAPALGNEGTVTDCVPINSNRTDKASAATGSDDGPAASISSNDGAAAAMTPANVEDVPKKKKKNLFQRIYSFFHRQTTRVVSTFKCGKN